MLVLMSYAEMRRVVVEADKTVGSIGASIRESARI